jgi:HSP20 family protein
MYPSLTRFPGDLFADFEGLQRQVEQILGLRGQPSSIRANGRGAFPALNVGSTPQAVEIYAFAPGIDPAKIELSVDKGLLTLAGEAEATSSDKAEGVSTYAKERYTGSFRRVVSLPEDVDTARVEATYRDGVLKVVIPKRESSKPRRITVGE